MIFELENNGFLIKKLSDLLKLDFDNCLPPPSSAFIPLPEHSHPLEDFIAGTYVLKLS